ncbi:hypothetical protein EJB05_50776, partial [Eragrostis curvula]
MADPEVENPILAAVVDDLTGRIFDVDFIQDLVAQVRAHVDETAAAYFEAEAQLAEVRRLLVEVAEDVVARLPPLDEGAVLLVEMNGPEVAARAAEYLELAARVDQLSKHHEDLVDAVLFLVILRAVAFAVTRARLLPRVLLAIAAAYALAYVASWGRVVPGLASLLRIAVLVLCFLLGRGPRLMLGV